MKSVLITGANRGIGLAHARRFAEAGATVYATAREPAEAKELNALGVSVLRYDAAAPDGAEALKAELGDAPLDLLFANAGVMGGASRLEDVSRENLLQTLAINSVAPVMLAQALADNVAASARKLIAVQSSLMGSIADNGSGGYYAYRMSKAALNMAARSLARDLAPRGIIAVTLHPGWVRTRMGGPSGKLDVDACAEAQQRLFAGLTKKQSGGFFNYDGRELPW